MLKVYYACSDEVRGRLVGFVGEEEVKEITIQTVVFMEVNSREQFVNIKNMKLQHECDFIFIVEEGSLIFDLLELKPLGFVRKQYIEDEKEVVKQLVDYKRKNMNALLTFQNGSNTLNVMPDKIVYLESQAHYLLINTTNAVFKVREKISDVIRRLAPYGFKQVHRSYIVNEKHLIAMTPNECVLTGQVRIPLSKKFK